MHIENLLDGETSRLVGTAAEFGLVGEAMEVYETVAAEGQILGRSADDERHDLEQIMRVGREVSGVRHNSPANSTAEFAVPLQGDDLQAVCTGLRLAVLHCRRFAAIATSNPHTPGYDIRMKGMRYGAMLREIDPSVAQNA